MPDSIADLGQRASAGQGVADERVPAVVFLAIAYDGYAVMKSPVEEDQDRIEFYGVPLFPSRPDKLQQQLAAGLLCLVAIGGFVISGIGAALTFAVGWLGANGQLSPAATIGAIVFALLLVLWLAAFGIAILRNKKET